MMRLALKKVHHDCNVALLRAQAEYLVQEPIKVCVIITIKMLFMFNLSMCHISQDFTTATISSVTVGLHELLL